VSPVLAKGSLRSLGVRPRLLLAGASLAVLAVVLAAGGWTKFRLGAAFAELSNANRGWLWLAGCAFAGAFLCGAAACRSVVCRCGGRLSLMQAVSRYGAGSLVNSFGPGWAGETVRILLFAKAFDSSRGAWTAGGVFGALSAARAIVLALLVVPAIVIGGFPLWPLPYLLGCAGLAIAVSVAARRGVPTRAAARLLEPLRALAGSPRGSLALLGWIVLSTACRVTAAAAIAAALGIKSAFSAALLIVPALGIAGLIPILPANLGVTSGAVAVALRSKGVDATKALSAGLALHAVELVVGLSIGLLSVFVLARESSGRARYVAAPLAAAAVLIVVVATVGAAFNLEFA
jgi:uncharacterized membrane protein YbhN (UPF0104 family)